MTRTLKLLGGGALLALGITLSPPAGAAGCNGVVDIFKWGCAPWDNNNGPQYPYHRKRVIELPANGTQIEERNGQRFAVRNGVRYPLISNVVPTNAGNAVPTNAGNLRVWAQ